VSFHVIADQDTVLGFRFAGVTGTVVDAADAAQEAFAEAVKANACQILLLTEQVEEWLERDVIAHRLAAAPPYIVTIESVWGPHGKRKTLEEMIYEAVGIRIVSDDSREQQAGSQ
jgi:vacuolar-type H+-ATPase subunit F/Vma7